MRIYGYTDIKLTDCKMYCISLICKLGETTFNILSFLNCTFNQFSFSVTNILLTLRVTMGSERGDH